MSIEVMDLDSGVDVANKAAMRQSGTVKQYLNAGYTDLGEKALLGAIEPEAKGRAILDIGVGGGRTAPMLTAISRDYTAIDYTPEMVSVFSERFPDLKILHTDARDMPMIADGSMFLVVFSCAGLDMVGGTDRKRILREIRRVLVPGGAFIFSTHNFDHRRREPEPRLWNLFFPGKATYHPFKLVRGIVGAILRGPLRVRNYRKLLPLAQQHEHWAILNSKYHHYATLMHYITEQAQREQLEEAGFSSGAMVCTNEGELLVGESSGSRMLHFLVRKPS